MRKCTVPILIGLLSFSAPLYADELVDNGAMEIPFREGIARGWHKNCYGKNTAVFSPGKPHSGKTSQKVECTSFESGAVQFFCPMKLTAGKHYKVSLWLRAEEGVGTVGISIRQGPHPYTKYLATTFEAGEDWEQVTFEGVIAQADKSAGLFIYFHPDGPGTLWVDDVSVVENEPQAVELPLPKGNVVANASFELALDRHWRARPVRPSCDTQNPHHGQRSLRWELDVSASQLVSGPIEFGGRNEPFTLALAVRAEGEARVVAAVRSAMTIGGAKNLLRVEGRPKADWDVLRTTGPLPSSANGAYCLTVHVRAPKKATVWIDALRLEPGQGSEPPRCRRQIEASLACPKLAHIHRIGQPVQLEVRAFNDGDGPKEPELICRVTDYHQRPVAEVPVAIRLEPRRAGQTSVSLPLKKTGVYLAELVEGDEVLSELSLSVLPEIAPVPAEKSVVGGHFRLDEFHMKVANAMGIKWTRIHDCSSITHWKTVEPEQGKFVWFDDEVRTVRRHGVQILGEFLRVPKWASSADDDVQGGNVHLCPPRSLDEFGTYVRAVVDHYENDIRHWEIWNEPYHRGFWQGTPEQYAEMARVAARETRAADPEAVVVAPCAYPGAEEWVERVLKAGGIAGADVFSYHGYGVLQPNGYQRVRGWAAHGRQSARPIWNTETGVTSRTFYRHIPDKFVDSYTRWIQPLPYDVAAENCARLFILALAGGAERYFQYWCVYEESLLPRLGAMTIFEYDTSLRPMAVAYAVAASLLDGTRGRGWIEIPGPVLANLLEDDQRLIAVLWRRGGRRGRRIAVGFNPVKLDARNMMGNPMNLNSRGSGFDVVLSAEPLYLIVPAAEGDALVAALRKAEKIR